MQRRRSGRLAPGAASTRLVLGCAVLAALAGGPASAQGLVFHAEREGGEVLATAHADGWVNPASVTKVATALFALDRLGADHRYATGFALAGTLDPATGILDGDLIVLGGADPDFHFESALLAASALNELGLRRVSGDLLVDDRFWMGWERGSENRETDPDRRLLQMADRFRTAIDPALWRDEQHRAWDAWRERSARLPPEPPAVHVEGQIRRRQGAVPPARLTYHSNPLPLLLKRFLAYSNNDIERVTDPLGGAPAVERFVEERVGLDPTTVELATTSGLGPNRMSPDGIVRLLRRFTSDLEALGLRPGDVLPMPGCDPGSLEHALPHWQDPPRRASMAAKTGTLIHEDGGVATLAGILYGAAGTAVYMVAAPRSGARIVAARADIESWVGDLADALDGPAPRACGAPVASVDERATVRRESAR